jgi:hypothetical protein
MYLTIPLAAIADAPFIAPYTSERYSAEDVYKRTLVSANVSHVQVMIRLTKTQRLPHANGITPIIVGAQ